MKTKLMTRLSGLLFFFILMTTMPNAAEEGYGRQQSGISFDYFYGTLRPYGQWIEVDHDLYAWRPYRVARTWAPYRDGRWVYSHQGWYWDSFEPFGWAVYHYGRWYNDDYYGWMWLPDDQWAPAWVEWRYDDDYIGWAPLPPFATFNISVGIRFTRDYHMPDVHWNYVKYGHFCNDDMYRYYIPEKYKYRIHKKTKYRNDYGYHNGVINRGIDRDFIEKKTGRKFEESRIIETSHARGGVNRNNPGSRRSIEVFRPDANELSRYKNEDKKDIQRVERTTGLRSSDVKLRQNAGERRQSERINNDRNIERKNVQENNRSNDSRQSPAIKRMPDIRRVPETNGNTEEINRTPRTRQSRERVQSSSGQERRRSEAARNGNERKTDNGRQQEKNNRGRH